MTFQSKVLLATFAVLLLISLVSTYPGDSGGTWITGEFGLVMLLVAIVEGLILLLAGIVVRLGKVGIGPVPYRKVAAAFFVAAGLVLLVGGSACMGGLLM